MFVSLFIALVFFRLIAAGAGESFSALDLSPGFFSGVFFLHLQAGLECVLRLRVFGSGWGCAGMRMQESACYASAGDSSARGRSARCAGYPIACCAVVPFVGPFSRLELEPLQHVDHLLGVHGPMQLFAVADVCGVAGASGCVWPQNGEGS